MLPQSPLTTPTARAVGTTDRPLQGAPQRVRSAAWRRERRELAALLELDIPDRTRRLDRIAARDEMLAGRLRRLLRVDEEESRFLSAPVFRVETPDGLLGRRVGPWRIDRQIGSGGMGVVYRGHRADGAFEKRVAIKLLHADRCSRRLVESFRRERQVLANLEHPGIPRILDGGLLDGRRPFLVMELVEGERIDAWLDARPADDATILCLLEQVCRIVAEAHARGIVHCDLKPAHILICDSGDRQTIRLLDFGIASLSGSTASGSSPGAFTKAFASPEQKLGELPTDRSDVFALGRILAALDVARRVPGIDPWIQRCTSLDPTRRPTAAALADALAELAGQGTRRRRRLRRMIGAAALAALLSLGAWNWHREAREARELERILAADPLADGSHTTWPTSPLLEGRMLLRAAQGDLDAGRVRRARVLAGRAFAAYDRAPSTISTDDWLSVGETLLTVGSVVPAERALSRAALPAVHDGSLPQVAGRRLRAGLLTAARLHGDLDRAFDQLRSIRPRLETPEPSAARQADRWLAAYLLDIGRPADAAGLLDAAVHGSCRGERPSVSCAGLHLDTASSLVETGHLDGARHHYEEAISHLERTAPPAHPEWRRSRVLLAALTLEEGASLSAFEMASSNLLATDTVETWDHPGLPLGVDLLRRVQCKAATNLRTLDRAEQLCRQAIEQIRRERGPNHPRVADLLLVRAEISALRGRFDRADDLTREASLAVPTYDGQTRTEGRVASYLALTALYRGELEDAVRLHREALTTLERAAGDDSIDVAQTHYHYALALLRNGHPEAVEALEGSVLRLEAILGTDHPRIAWTWKNLTQAYLIADQPEAARRALTRARDVASQEDQTLWAMIERLEPVVTARSQATQSAGSRQR